MEQKLNEEEMPTLHEKPSWQQQKTISPSMAFPGHVSIRLLKKLDTIGVLSVTNISRAKKTCTKQSFAASKTRRLRDYGRS